MDYIFKGQTHEILLPSGRKITIRENNGDDEETLTKLGNTKTNKNVQIYLSNIITDDSEPRKEGVAPLDHVGNMKSSDASYAIFKQRLINLGPEFTFSATCPVEDCEHRTEYEEDVLKYDRDLSLPFEKFEQEMKDAGKSFPEDIVREYPLGNTAIVERVLSSGLRIRFKILTLKLERWRLEQKEDTLSNNTVFYERELEYLDEGNWIMAKNFKAFSSKMMVELRGLVRKFDFTFDPIIEFKCEKCGTPSIRRLLAMPDFFYPAEKF